MTPESESEDRRIWKWIWLSMLIVSLGIVGLVAIFVIQSCGGCLYR